MANESKKHSTIRDLQSALFGRNVVNSIREDLCIACRKPAAEFSTDIARKEFSISGLCESCQKEAFAPLEEDHNE